MHGAVRAISLSVGVLKRATVFRLPRHAEATIVEHPSIPPRARSRLWRDAQANRRLSAAETSIMMKPGGDD
jgi:hypothetical protein